MDTSENSGNVFFLLMLAGATKGGVKHRPTPQSIKVNVEKELSEEQWCSRFPGSIDTDDLEGDFRTNCKEFIANTVNKLQHHAIPGLLSLGRPALLDLDGKITLAIPMQSLAATWTDWFDDPANKQSNNTLTVLRKLNSLLATYQALPQKGFTHGNIGEGNIMFDSKGNPFIIDIDLIPKADEYSWYREKRDLRQFNGFLVPFIGQHAESTPIYQFWIKTCRVDWAKNIGEYKAGVEEQIALLEGRQSG